MFANPYRQDPASSTAFLCVSVLVGELNERLFHAEVVGPPISGDEDALHQFEQVKLVGPCDESCCAKHPGSIHQMMKVGPTLHKAIVSEENFGIMVAQATPVRI